MHSPALEQLILQALNEHPDGISEYNLIKWIANAGHPQFEPPVLGNPLTLFQTHFLLFHHLHCLNRRLVDVKQAGIEINPLRICLTSYRDAIGQQLGRHDPLRDYYLDWSNFEQTDAQQVSDMLNGFWRRLHGDEQRRAALAVLELQDPVDFDAIKSQYRRLAMRHHPDKGGDKRRLQTINAAMRLLDKAYRIKMKQSKD